MGIEGVCFGFLARFMMDQNGLVETGCWPNFSSKLFHLISLYALMVSSGKLISGIISCFQDSNEVQVEKNDADPYLQPVVKGMLNLGNTCYLNSTIQALRSNPILSKFLAERAHFFPASGVFRALNALF